MIKQALIAAGFMLMAIGASYPEVQAQETSRSVYDGVYTTEQATSGKAQFTEHCVSCHGATLAGGDKGPALIGRSFLYNWTSLSVEDLVERIQTTMPADSPGSLSRRAAADLAAYILSANKIPPGTVALPADSEVLRNIRIDATAPGG
jgi:mono/diheme cytochrome c family protein